MAYSYRDQVYFKLKLYALHLAKFALFGSTEFEARVLGLSLNPLTFETLRLPSSILSRWI